MKRMIPATTLVSAMLVFAAGPASGIDGAGVSVGATVGSVSADVNAAVGSDGVSAGASVGTSSVSGGISGSAGAAGVGGGAGVSAEGNSATGATAASSRSATQDAQTTFAAAATGHHQIRLPPLLLPCKGEAACHPGQGEGSEGGGASAEAAAPEDLVVIACVQSATVAATPYGATSVQARRTGQSVQLSDGSYQAPLYMEIIYAHADGPETRQADVLCQLDSEGYVSGIVDA